MAREYKTRAGISPSENKLPFEITTSEVEDYLQKKVNVVIDQMRKNQQYAGADVEVNVVTMEMGNNFFPFMVVLPMSVIKGNKKRNKSELSIFNPKDEDGTVKIIDPIIRMFSSYTFDDADGRAFSSCDWRRARGVSANGAASLKANRRPRITRFDNGKFEKVTFLIDPIRVFHEMLIMEGNNANFKVDITGWQKQRNGQYTYTMERVVYKNSKKKRNHIAAELARSIKGYK